MTAVPVVGARLNSAMGSSSLKPGFRAEARRPLIPGRIVVLRKSLRDLDAIVPKLRELGARHVTYGAKPEHYPVVGDVLIGAIATIAGPAWQAEHEQAWRRALAIVSGAMLDGAEAADLEAAA
jgi:nitric oxide dioxygenase